MKRRKQADLQYRMCYIAQQCQWRCMHTQINQNDQPTWWSRRTHVPCILPSYSLPQLSELPTEGRYCGHGLGILEKRVKARRPTTRGDISERLDERVGAPGGEWWCTLSASTGARWICQTGMLLVPTKVRQTILEAVHDKWGHRGMMRTLGLLQRRCFWPGLHADVRHYIKMCFKCTVAKAPTPTVRNPMRHLLAFRPVEILAIDFLEMDRGRGGYEDILLLIDVYSKYDQAIPCKDQRVRMVAKVLSDVWFVHYRIPLQIHFDQGRDFESDLIKWGYNQWKRPQLGRKSRQ